MKPLLAAHVVISGFCQTVDRPTGCQRIWMELRRLCSPETQVLLGEWNSNWEKLAEAIFLCSRVGDYPREEDHPRVFVYAYSWGAGCGFPRFASALALRGIMVQEAVLCDPIYRPRMLPSWCTGWLSLIRTMRVAVPWNVKEVRGVRQKDTFLRGHDVVKEDPGQKTRIHKFLEVRAGHCHIDDSPLFLDMCMKTAGIEL